MTMPWDLTEAQSVYHPVEEDEGTATITADCSSCSWSVTETVPLPEAGDVAHLIEDELRAHDRMTHA